MKTSWTIYFLALCFGLYETSYFGWNWTPGSPSAREGWKAAIRYMREQEEKA